VTYVVAAGNSDWDFDYGPIPDVPAAYPQVLTVTAVSDSDGLPGALGGGPGCDRSEKDDRYASFSNFAATPGGAAHTIAAPGVCILSTTPGGNYDGTYSGTSMATPHIAGAVALCIGEAGTAGPCAGLTPAQIVQKMRADASAYTTAHPTYGFAGDPAHPVSGRYFGYLYRVDTPVPPEDPPLDETPPEVTTVSPSDGATGVSTSTEVAVTFTEPMDEPATEAAFSLARSSDASPVGGSFSWSGNTLTFDPASALSEGTNYAATVSTAATDEAGNPLGAATTWGFKTISNVTTAPGSTTILAGSLRSGGASNLGTDNNSFFNVNSTNTKTFTSAWYGSFPGVSRSLSNLSVTYSGKNSRSCSQTLSIRNFSTQSWVQLDARSVGTTEVKIVRSPTGTLANYVKGTGSEGAVRVRVRCTNPTASFYSSGDLMSIGYSKS
jgi:hypothetical protein